MITCNCIFLTLSFTFTHANLQKAVAKMNIQRILMDARFGIGACARMIHEEEFNEAAVTTAVPHELASAQQHVDNTSRR